MATNPNKTQFSINITSDAKADLQRIVDDNPQWRSLNHLIEVILIEYIQQNKGIKA